MSILKFLAIIHIVDFKHLTMGTISNISPNTCLGSFCRKQNHETSLVSSQPHISPFPGQIKKVLRLPDFTHSGLLPSSGRALNRLHQSSQEGQQSCDAVELLGSGPEQTDHMRLRKSEQGTIFQLHYFKKHGER